MVYALSRRGVSATVATLFGVVALLLGMVAFTATTVYIVRAAQSGSAAVGSYAGESKAVVKIYAVLEMEKSGDVLLNKTYLVMENLWPDEATIDHVAVASRSGSLVAEKALSIKLKPGESIQVKPSDIDPSLAAYDDDFWRFKREVGYFEIHVDVGGQGSSFKSYPEFKVGSSPLEMVTMTAGGSTITTTVTRTVTTTYVTTPTKTVTTTCTHTTCIQRNIVGGYTVVRVRAPTTIVVTKTIIIPEYCFVTYTVTITSYLTSTTTTVKGVRVGKTTCDLCGRCPTGIYGASTLNVHPPQTLYLIAPVIALALAPKAKIPGKRRSIALALAALAILVSLASPHNVKAETITITVTGTGTTTTATITSTTTTTVTSTAPTKTYTVTSTVLSTEYRCYKSTTTVTITDRPIIVSTSTLYKSSSCHSLLPTATVTKTIVTIRSTVTGVYYVSTYWVVCRRSV